MVRSFKCFCLKLIRFRRDIRRMGESRRRRQAIANEPCRCGSGKAAAICCLGKFGWHKPPASIDLSGGESHCESHPRCYLRELNGCSEDISGEHIVSASVLRIISPNKNTIVSGFPWLNGKEKLLGHGALISNCLCKHHNSSLSPLDDAAGRFYQAIKNCDLERSGRGQHYLFSGHDVERWMFKTMANMIASKSLAHDGKVLTSTFHSKVQVATMLTDISGWLPGTGMYLMLRKGEEIARGDHFWLEPYTIRDPAEVVGMKTSMQGLEFTFLGLPMDKGSAGIQGIYRPKSIQFVHGKTCNTIEFSWDDGLPHIDVELQFSSTVGDRIASGRLLPPNYVKSSFNNH